MSLQLAITGMAFASPFGSEPEAFWQGLCQGPSPAVDWRSAGDGFPEVACRAAPLPPGSPEGLVPLGLALAQGALASAGLEALPPGAGLAVGSAWGVGDRLHRPGQAHAPGMLGAWVEALGVRGPATTTPVACAAGNAAIAWAARRVAAGEAPMMLAGGLDLIGPSAAGVFGYLDNLTHDRPRPFDQARDGFLLADGGALFLLEPVASARAAGRRILARLSGVGGAHDASHPTRPDPSGRGMHEALAAAWEEAGRPPLGYVNAHAPGTEANDLAEAEAIASLFGRRGVPVSSTKGALGHAQGGANALEAVACILALHQGLAPPTLHLEAPVPELAERLDLIQGSPRPLAPGQAVASLATSLGGAVWALVLEGGEG